MVDERDEDEVGDGGEEERPARPARKKKRKKASARRGDGARPRKRKRRARADDVEEAQASDAQGEAKFTGGQLLGALLAGAVIGGLVGYKAAPAATADASKDPAAASAQPAVKKASGPQTGQSMYVASADYSPRKGPRHAKVTIMEFVDFQ